ncbi:MAG TPA: hypothetical protein PKY59_18730 [Pyrinomonadaceae bacterium]|nr:hypothetical protein [Pyrinomonadaceae bacterium]
MAFRRWFPLALQEQAAFFRNFTRVFVEIAVSLGFTAEDIAKLEADNAVMQYLAQMDYGLQAYMKSFSSFKRNITTSKERHLPVYPILPDFAEPPIVPYGIFQRLFKLADRIEASDGYTESIGGRLGILPKAKEALRIEELDLQLKIETRAEGVLIIRFVKGKTNGVNLYVQRENSADWQDFGRFFKSPVELKLGEKDAKPETVQIRGRYIIGNKAVGEMSAQYQVVLLP